MEGKLVIDELVITKKNMGKVFKDGFNENLIYKVDLNAIIDADINPREIDKKYAEQIPSTAPPIILGAVMDKNDEFYKKLIIIDGNHRYYSYTNVLQLDRCAAYIKKYENLEEATLEAFKYNIYHGKRLTDKEIANGIRRIAVVQKKKTGFSYEKLAKKLSMRKTTLLEYITWDKVEKVLNISIPKAKGSKLYFFLKEENGIEKMKKFYELNKNLPYRKFKELIKYYVTTKEIIDYDRYLIKKALMIDSCDDCITKEENSEIKPAPVIEENILDKMKQNDSEEKNIEENDDDKQTNLEIKENSFNETEEEIVPDDSKEEEVIPTVVPLSSETDNPLEITEEEIVDKKRIEEEERKKALIEEQKKEKEKEKDKLEITEDKKIEFILGKNQKQPEIKENKENNNLVQVKGLVRKYQFTTVMKNIFSDLQNDIIDSKSLLEETLKDIHGNRKEFNDKKEEYLSVLRNCNNMILKMADMISKVNKDFKE